MPIEKYTLSATPHLIVDTQARVDQVTPVVFEDNTSIYQAGQTLSQILILQPGKQYSPQVGFSSLVMSTSAPVQLVGARGSNPAYINQIVNKQIAIDDQVDFFSLTNPSLTEAITIRFTAIVYIGAPLPSYTIVTSLNGLTGALQLLPGTGISIDNANAPITISNTGVLTINGQSGDITLNANNLPDLAKVAITGNYNDLLNKPSPYQLPIATASTLGGVMIGSGIDIDGVTGQISVNPTVIPVKSVNGQVGDVVIQAADNGDSTTVSLITDNGASTGTLRFNRLKVSGPTLTASASNGILTITSSSPDAPVLTVDGQAPDVQGNITIKAQDANTASGSSLIVNDGSTSGIITTRRIVAGTNINIVPDSNDNLLIENIQQPYALPIASSSQLGGVKIGSNISVSGDGTISVDTPYTLPVASDSVLGGVKIGANVSVTADGTISVAAPYTLPIADGSTLGGVKLGTGIVGSADGTISVETFTLAPATDNVLGGVKIGANVNVTSDGTISVAAPYVLPQASSSTLGGVKIGSNVNVAADGTISVAAPYALPTASGTTLGGVKIGSGISIAGDGTISVSSYALPVATDTVLGGVKIGANVNVTADGTISVEAPYVLPVASSSTLGGVKIGANIQTDSSGTISVAAPYVLPIASSSTLGGVKIGSGITVTADGTISASNQYTLPTATASVLGGVKIGANVNVTSDGTISVAAPYVLPRATNSSLGGIIIGTGFTTDPNGTLNAIPAPVQSVNTQTGAVEIKALPADNSSGYPLIVDDGHTSGTMTFRNIAAGTNVTITQDGYGNYVINSTGNVTSVNGKTGAVTIQAQDNNGSTGTSLIADNGAVSGTIKLLRLVPGSNMTLMPDSSGNLVFNTASSGIKTVNGQGPDNNGNVNVTPYNTGSGVAIISATDASGRTSFKGISPGSNISVQDAGNAIQINAVNLLKTVNGISPDPSGNVNVTLPGLRFEFGNSAQDNGGLGLDKGNYYQADSNKGGWATFGNLTMTPQTDGSFIVPSGLYIVTFGAKIIVDDPGDNYALPAQVVASCNDTVAYGFPGIYQDGVQIFPDYPVIAASASGPTYTGAIGYIAGSGTVSMGTGPGFIAFSKVLGTKNNIPLRLQGYCTMIKIS
jgi:hypothetical protein